MNFQVQAPCYITLLSISAEDGQENILDLINQLIQTSASVGFCIEEEPASNNGASPWIKPLAQAKDILREDKNDSRSNWPSKNCIVLGSLRKPLKRINLDFLHDCRADHPNGHYDQFCQTILAYYDWAIFSYFTTYGSRLLTFITKQKHVDVWLHSLPHLDIAERYDSPSLGMAQLRSATFYDYQEQWLLPIWLAEQLQAPAPLLLCIINPDESMYNIYSHKDNDYIEDSNYLTQHTAKLTLVEEWQGCPYSGHTTPLYQFQLFRITDLEAYYSLWSKTSSESCIAHCVISADCDLSLLKEYCNGAYIHMSLSQLIKTKKLASWGYDNFYGGGADEHLGLFYANDGKITDLFWRALEKDVHAILPERLHTTIFYNENEHWQLPLLLNNKQREMPIILCQINPEMTYNLWSPEDFKYIENTIWYEDILPRLTCLDTFVVNGSTYHIYLLNDEAAYHELCASDTMGYPIVHAIFAADCDIAALKNILCQADYYIAEDVKQVARWVLSIYDDESSAYFYAKDTQDCQLFCELLIADEESYNAQVSRF